MSSYKKVELPDNPPQPNLEGEHPEIISTGIYEGISYVAGKGRKSADCMFLMSSLFEEDARDGVIGSYGKILKDEPCFMKSQAGSSLIDLVNSFGIARTKIYSTAIIKWLLPKDRRTKPTSQELAYGAKFFEKEMQLIQPKLVICLGKQAFDFFSPYTLRADDVMAGVFWSQKYNCYYTLQHPIQLLQAKPFLIDEYKVGLKEAISLLQESYGIDRCKVEKNYRTIYSSTELLDLVFFLKQNNFNLLSVDCEWSGLNPWMGELRSLQIAWAPGHGAYIRFMDDQKNFVFDVSYKVAGDILRMHTDSPDVKFVGHHFSADSVWLEQTLGIDTYEKCYLDTEFACQCINEHSPLGLEYVSMKYTDLGRYDMDLLIWRKTHPQKPEDGFGLIPDELMIPYAIADVDAVIRAVPFIVKELEQQQLTDYYFNYFNKFVTDVFTHFTTTGLKMCTNTLEDLRILYGFCKDKLEKKFIECIVVEAEDMMRTTLEPLGMGLEEAVKFTEENLDTAAAGLQIEASRLSKLITHYQKRHNFNFRSGDDMRRWLFDVKCFEPFKSTPQKDKGRPSLAWEKVKTLAPDLQKLYTPSADKQTLSIYAERDSLVKRLVGLNLVGNIYKMCLKPADLDEDGNVIRENGLFFFLDPNGFIRPNFSSTETGRPRAWKPNVLNWPSFVHKRINEDILSILTEHQEMGTLPPELERFINEGIPSIRSCVTVPEGYVMVESDYKTAEIRALAFISGDENLIKLMTEPDQQFGLVKNEDGSTSPVRLSYDKNCGIPIANQDQDIIMTVTAEGKLKRKVTEEELLRDENGHLTHPDADLHWSLVEFIKEKPREFCSKKADRDALGKVGNFSTAYGASANSLERKIEADTGVKPEPGTGDKIFAGLKARQGVAVEYLEQLQILPSVQPSMTSASGRVRHFQGTNDKTLSFKERKSLMSSQGREARNFPMQESVGATAMRACIWLIKQYRDLGLSARVMICLYDALVSICKLEERHIVARLHEMYMCELNEWEYHDRKLTYPIDTEYVFRWSATKLTKEEEKLLQTK